MTFDQFDYEKPERVLVSSKTKEKAIRALLGNDVSPEVFEKVGDYIEKEYREINCCVIYSCSKKCKDFLDSLHLDIGKKEVVITENQMVLFSDNYRFCPTLYN